MLRGARVPGRRRALVRWTATAVVIGCAVGCDAAAPAGDGAARVFVSRDVQVLATSESLAYVVDLEVLADGRIWVLNSIDPFLIGFGPDGTPLGEHGHAGGGPTELGQPVAFVMGGIEGEAWALDATRHDLVLASRPGAAGSRIPLPRDSLPPGSLIGGRDPTLVRVRTARLGDEIVVPRSTLPRDGGWIAMWHSIWGADLIALDPLDGSSRTVVALGGVLGDPRPHLPEVSDPLPFPAWFRLWTVCPGEGIRVHDRLGNQIRGFDADGSELTPIPLPEPTLLKVTREQFAIAVLEAAAVETAGSIGVTPPRVDSAALLPGLRSRIEGDPEQLASLLPRYVDLHCTDDGVLWIRPFDVELGGLRGGPTWLRVSPGGDTRPVRFPPRFDPLRFTTDRIWGVLRDELDVAAVAWIEW